MAEPTDLGIAGLSNIERIGSGGNAVVYRARQDDLDRDVVVKVLLNVDAETTRRRFDRERRAMGRLSQAAGIAPLYGSGFTPGGLPYLLMPFYQRGSLQEWIDTDGALAPAQVREIGVVMARAVQTAHENGVLHRDLKPANILMKRSGEPDVADFGIAHLIDDALGTSQALTMTPLYTAPEVFDGVESGAASDIYSLGATLFAMLQGRPAFSDPDGATPMLSLMRRIHEEPLPDLPATVPRELGDVVAKSMEKNPLDRYPTAGELADELAAANLATRSRKALRPSTLVMAALIVLLVAVGGAALAAFMLRDDGDETVQAPEVTATVTPAPVASTAPTNVPSAVAGTPFDLDAASDVASQALVRVEAFSCSGAELATGVVLNDGIVITTDQVLSSPWWIDVTIEGQTLHANPETADRERGLGVIVIAEPEGLVELPSVAVRPGDQVAIVGIDGRPALATIADRPTESDELVATLVDDRDGNAIEPVDLVVVDSGAIVGIATVDAGTITVLTQQQVQDDWTASAPAYDCPLPVTRDLSASDAESAISPAIAELLTMQHLNDAYAAEQWDRVRSLEPGKAEVDDQQFIAEWRPLRRGYVFPIERTIDDDGLARWRIGLIGHETWGGTDLTTLFCLTWTVDPVSGAVTQTDEDNVTVYGSKTGQPRQQGFVDPDDLRPLIDDNCQLS